MKKIRQARDARQTNIRHRLQQEIQNRKQQKIMNQKKANTQYNRNDETGTYINIDNKPNPKNSLLHALRSSIKSLKNVKVKLPTPRSISMKIGSRRLISALVSNRFKQQMGPRATRRAKTI